MDLGISRRGEASPILRGFAEVQRPPVAGASISLFMLQLEHEHIVNSLTFMSDLRII